MQFICHQNEMQTVKYNDIDCALFCLVSLLHSFEKYNLMVTSLALGQSKGCRNFVVIGGKIGCHNDNLLCLQWRTGWYHDNSWLSVNQSNHGPAVRPWCYVPWASCKIRKIAGAHAPGMPGTFSPPPQVSDTDMHHGTCVTHVPWCMPGSLTSGFLWSRSVGKTFPAFPAHAQPAILCIW